MSKVALAKLLGPRWTEERASRVRLGLQRRSRRRRVVRALGAALGTLGVLAGLAVLLHSRAFVRLDSFLARTPTHIVESQPTGGPSGSAVATLLTPDSELVPEPDGGGRSFSLRQGGARIVVSHEEGQSFRGRGCGLRH